MHGVFKKTLECLRRDFLFTFLCFTFRRTMDWKAVRLVGNSIENRYRYVAHTDSERYLDIFSSQVASFKILTALGNALLGEKTEAGNKKVS